MDNILWSLKCNFRSCNKKDFTRSLLPYYIHLYSNKVYFNLLHCSEVYFCCLGPARGIDDPGLHGALGEWAIGRSNLSKTRRTGSSEIKRHNNHPLCWVHPSTNCWSNKIYTISHGPWINQHKINLTSLVLLYSY
jgi:hypothetical protein